MVKVCDTTKGINNNKHKERFDSIRWFSRKSVYNNNKNDYNQIQSKTVNKPIKIKPNQNPFGYRINYNFDHTYIQSYKYPFKDLNIDTIDFSKNFIPISSINRNSCVNEDDLKKTFIFADKNVFAAGVTLFKKIHDGILILAHYKNGMYEDIGGKVILKDDTPLHSAARKAFEETRGNIDYKELLQLITNCESVVFGDPISKYMSFISEFPKLDFLYKYNNIIKYNTNIPLTPENEKSYPVLHFGDQINIVLLHITQSNFDSFNFNPKLNTTWKEYIKNLLTDTDTSISTDINSLSLESRSELE